MKRLIVVQARMSSTRLPGKVLLPLAGKPLLQRQLERIRAARADFELCVATTPAVGDEPIVELCRELDVWCFRGHPTDLLDRHLMAGRAARADVVVKIPSDCPLIDPAAIERVLDVQCAAPEAHLVTNLWPPTWPDGNDVEAISIDALEAAHAEASDAEEREHTTPFIWRRPERFEIRNVRWQTGVDLSKSVRLTIDYPEDYQFIAAVYSELMRERGVFGLGDILDLLDRKPELWTINRRHVGETWQTRRASCAGTILQGSRHPLAF
jgi:spore coat polysaccharide biosynthesis protein SpsF